MKNTFGSIDFDNNHKTFDTSQRRDSVCKDIKNSKIYRRIKLT